MNHHLNQAAHNQDFHDCIVKEFSTKFYDWKITTLFYTSLHLLKALGEKRGINIGTTHQDIEQNCNPDRNNCKMSLSKTAWKNYKSLYRYAHTARYEGITDVHTFEILMHNDYQYCLLHIADFKKYVQGQGLPI
jgi:hypothetical protein